MFVSRWKHLLRHGRCESNLSVNQDLSYGLNKVLHLNNGSIILIILRDLQKKKHKRKKKTYNYRLKIVILV